MVHQPRQHSGIAAGVMLSLLTTLATLPVNAATFQFQCEGATCGRANNSHGIHDAIDTTYSDTRNVLTWSSTFTPDPQGDIPNGAWLVLSPGPNPKQHVDEYAIFYLDGEHNRISAYAYNGQNNSRTYEDPTRFLQAWDNALNIVDDPTTGQRTLSFSLDVTNINNARNDTDWIGAAFGEKIGIWFHATKDPQATYDALGRLTFFTGSAGWYDKKNKMTTLIPEPTLLLGLGLIAGWGVVQRRKGKGSSDQ